MNELSLNTLLHKLNGSSLQKLARAHGLSYAGMKKAHVVQRLAERLSDARQVRQMLAELSPASRQIFERVQQTGGCAHSQKLLRELTQEGIVHAVSTSRVERGSNGTPDFGEALWPLLEHGLLHSTVHPRLLSARQVLLQSDVDLVIPREISDALQPAGSTLRAVGEDCLERRVEGVAQNFQRDVYLYWNYLRDQRVTLTASSLVPKRHLSKINEAMIDRHDPATLRDESHAPRLHFIRLLMEEAGLIRCTNKQLETTANAQDFFSYTITRRSDRFFEAWKKSTQWNELLHLPIKPRAHEERSARAAQLVVRARQYVLKLIAEGAGDGWLSLDDLTGRARRQNYEFLFRRTREEFGEVNPYYYYHNPLGWGFPVGDESEGWEKVEREFIHSIVRQPLHWLGLVSLGYQSDGLVAFQLTALGAYLLGIKAQPPSEETAKVSGRVVVQPNFQIFALEPIGEQTLASLDGFADRVKADKVFEYHLTRESLYRAQQSGMSVQDVIAFLQQSSTAPLPQNVQRTLEDWEQSYQRIVVRKNVSLIHALDPAVLDALQAEPASASVIRSRPLPRVAIAASDHESRARLLQALMTHGQLPAHSHADDSTQRAALTLDADGRVTFLHAVPNIFLLQELEQHAERRADAYYLTEASVKGARSAGHSTEQIVARWAEWHHGPLPTALLIQIKRWGQFYGRARVQRVIQLPDADVATALLQDVELGPLIKAYPADSAAIVVADEHVEQVRALLVARGITVA